MIQSTHLIIITLLMSSTPLFADRLTSNDPKKIPHSVPLADIEERINEDKASDGSKYSITVKDGVLSIDLISIPGNASKLIPIRAIFMVGRLAAPEYSEMHLTDQGDVIFKIEGTTIRSIGEQFVWGEEGKGENPIHLIRLFADALRDTKGERVCVKMNGSLMGDTQKAISALNERVHPQWTLKTTKLTASQNTSTP